MPVVSRSPRDGSRVFKAQTKYGQHVRVLGTSNRSNIHGILRSGKAGRKGYKAAKASFNHKENIPPTPIIAEQVQKDNSTIEASHTPAAVEHGSLPLALPEVSAEDSLTTYFDNLAEERCFPYFLPDSEAVYKAPGRRSRLNSSFIDEALEDTGVFSASVFSRQNTDTYLVMLGYTTREQAEEDGIDVNGFFVNAEPGWAPSRARRQRFQESREFMKTTGPLAARANL